MSEVKEWVGWFRNASPYINSQRKQVMVLALSGSVIEHSNFENIVHDISLLSSLGVRLVLVLGARPQINANLAKNNCQSNFHLGLRVTEPNTVHHVLEAYGRIRSEVEAKLSMGLINSPMHGAKLKVVSGNYVMARPHGVINGVDLGLTGHVRSIDKLGITKQLDDGSVVLMTSTGYSVTGDVFNLSYEELACEVAAKLSADKIIFFGLDRCLKNDTGALLRQITIDQAEQYANTKHKVFSEEQISHLSASAKACANGVTRAHIISHIQDGALLEELFTRDGSGTMVSLDEFDQIRPARLEDTNGILKLIQPLEEQGYLVRRSRELLETELDYFLVEVRDNAIIACVGLYPFPADQAGELSCFAVDSAYRKEGRGDRLLSAIEGRARTQKLMKLFVLTTKTEHWFKERGFNAVSKQDLPGNKNYNSGRNAKVLMKTLN